MKNLEIRRSLKIKFSLVLSVALLIMLTAFSLHAQILDVEGEAIIRDSRPKITLFDSDSGQERIESRWRESDDNIFIESLRGHLAFGTGANGTAFRRMIITEEGKVGIGLFSTQFPDARLEVNSSTNLETALHAENNYVPGDGTGVVAIGGRYGLQAKSIDAPSSASTSGLRYAIHGEADGGTFANYGILCDVGNSGLFNYAGQFNGDVHVTGIFTNPSDVKLKENIVKPDNILSKVKALEVRSYKYKRSYIDKMGLPTMAQMGFIAQDMQAIFPDLVQKQLFTNTRDQDDTEEYLGVNYLGLIPILTKGIQELSDYADLLERRVEALEALVIQSSSK